MRGEADLSLAGFPADCYPHIGEKILIFGFFGDLAREPDLTSASILAVIVEMPWWAGEDNVSRAIEDIVQTTQV